MKNNNDNLPLDATVVIARQKRFYSKLVYRAICDIVNNRNSESEKARELYEHAYEWMYNGFVTECEDETEYTALKEFDDALSFNTACFLLNWDPDWVRDRVKKLTRAELDHIGRNGLI